MKPIDKKNLQTQKLIEELYKFSKENKKEVYAIIAKQLKAPVRKTNGINLFKLQKLNYVTDGDTVVIPGKLLGCGNLDKKITIYANKVSKSTILKYNNIKLLSELIKDKVDYKKIKIIK